MPPPRHARDRVPLHPAGVAGHTARTALSGKTQLMLVSCHEKPRRARAPAAARARRRSSPLAAPPGLDGHRADLPDRRVLSSRFRLTEREAEVTLLLAERLSSKEIARALDVSPYTARRHTERVLCKLGINSRRDVLAAITAGPS